MNWEYDQIVSERISKDALNTMGAAGWEHYHVDGNTHFFKRLKSHNEEIRDLWQMIDMLNLRSEVNARETNIEKLREIVNSAMVLRVDNQNTITEAVKVNKQEINKARPKNNNKKSK